MVVTCYTHLNRCFLCCVYAILQQLRHEEITLQWWGVWFTPKQDGKSGRTKERYYICVGVVECETSGPEWCSSLGPNQCDEVFAHARARLLQTGPLNPQSHPTSNTTQTHTHTHACTPWDMWLFQVFQNFKTHIHTCLRPPQTQQIPLVTGAGKQACALCPKCYS